MGNIEGEKRGGELLSKGVEVNVDKEKGGEGKERAKEGGFSKEESTPSREDREGKELNVLAETLQKKFPELDNSKKITIGRLTEGLLTGLSSEQITQIQQDDDLRLRFWQQIVDNLNRSEEGKELLAEITKGIVSEEISPEKKEKEIFEEKFEEIEEISEKDKQKEEIKTEVAIREAIESGEKIDDHYNYELRKSLAEKCDLSWISNFEPEGVAFARKKDQGYNFLINEQGEKISEDFKEINPFSEGLALVEKNNRCFFINKEGKQAFEKEFLEAKSFSEGVAAVLTKKTYSDDRLTGAYYQFIDKNGHRPPTIRRNFIAHSHYTPLKSFHEGFAFFTDYFVDKNGKKYNFPKMEEKKYRKELGWRLGRFFSVEKSIHHEEGFNEGFVPVKYWYEVKGLNFSNDKEKYYFFDTEGNPVFRGKSFDYAQGFSEGLAFIVENEKGFYINKDGDRAFPGDFSRAEKFSQGLAAVRGDDDKWYYIDKNGNEAFPGRKFYDTKKFSDGVACVKETAESSWYYIGRDGKEIFSKK